MKAAEAMAEEAMAEAAMAEAAMAEAATEEVGLVAAQEAAMVLDRGHQWSGIKPEKSLNLASVACACGQAEGLRLSLKAGEACVAARANQLMEKPRCGRESSGHLFEMSVKSMRDDLAELCISAIISPNSSAI